MTGEVPLPSLEGVGAPPSFLWLRGAILFLAGLLLGLALARRPAPSPAPVMPRPSAPGAASAAGTVVGAGAAVAAGAVVPASTAVPVGAPSGPAPAVPADAALRARAERGELAALTSLERADERQRSPEDALALARGHGALALRDLEALVASIREEPGLAHDRSTLARLHHFLDEPLPLDTLVQLGKVPGPESLDLLHSVWRRRGPDTVGLLARDLLRREGALEGASGALRVAVELERQLEERPARPSQQQRRCERLQALLPRAAAEGDRRCAPQLAELERRDGCGPDGKQDCHPCLRDGEELREAQEAIRRREAPAPWLLPRR